MTGAQNPRSTPRAEFFSRRPTWPKWHVVEREFDHGLMRFLCGLLVHDGMEPRMGIEGAICQTCLRRSR